jgi:hypothetical protein
MELVVVRGTAPEMTPDLKQIIDGVVAELPDMQREQLAVKFPADDDGLWFFWRHGGRTDQVQIESSTGACPFLIETNRDNERRSGDTPDEVVRTIAGLLR